ncbi:hypothetical protein SARC_09686 [Sphaeroforma arctica JP610]|uniref:Uncharacterized protein n=1 Tax=Sphaeroforma arctica JP610 TaxID=667725 RepID=A0A0L0FM79_9EUKA|nr:hypothetical protein SARC_09686 [Sphaeroforma arctica JP610]KNC77865.1 hypothetical protein SARC_09686 [Sphaeroforma arctica JP610]|eukprot:XP_014151767.1 hypothetical protein SARC_09686 [Sphaeroforma arctica JP610]
MGDVANARAVPEIIENTLTESLEIRTRGLSRVTGLGPPDLCQYTKVQEKTQSLLRSNPVGPSVLGCFHFVYGVDCSSPAAVAAYFNTLVNDLRKAAVNTKASWRIQSGTYCCYNAFAGVDVRVEVTMPGTVNAYVLDNQGRRYGCDERMWQEVQLCSVLRYVEKPSPFDVPIFGLRTFHPFKRPGDERAFLKTATELFWDAHALGTDELTANVTNVNNKLTQGVKKYFLNSLRYHQCMSFFLLLARQDTELVCVLTEIQHFFQQTASALVLVSDHLLTNNTSSACVLKQSQLLLDRGNVADSLTLAKRAVDMAPAQAQVWIHLAKTYVADRQFDLALVALNVAPMSHGLDVCVPDIPDFIPSANVNEVLRDMVDEESEGDQTLASLPASNLRGTFVEAYAVLTSVLNIISWDELLAHRTQVFLMEDEYARNKEEVQSSSKSESDVKAEENEGKDTDKQSEVPATANDTTANDTDGKTDEDDATPTPTSDTEKDSADEPKGKDGVSEAADMADDEVSQPTAASPTPPEANYTGTKRLLERWLDQLFTALYQDLMCSVIWNAQEQHAIKTGSRVEHTIGDLLRYGYLANRLGKKEDAIKAFQQCTSQGFCLRGLLAIVDMYADDGFVEETLATVDAICQFYELNTDYEIPVSVHQAVYKLIRKHGVAMLNQLGGKWVTRSPHVKRIIDNGVSWAVTGHDQ